MNTFDDGSETFINVSELVPDAVAHISKLMNNPNIMFGIPTCFTSLDHFTNGLQRGDLIVVAGRPCMGERSFVCNIATHVALVNKLSVAIMENEVGGVALAIRLLASRTEINWHELRSGQISIEEFEHLSITSETIKNAPIYFSSFTPISVLELGKRLRQLNQKTGGLGLVVLDCLPEIKRVGEKPQSCQGIQIAQISRDLKALAQEINVPVIVLSPVERDIEERDNKRPLLSDLPNSGAIANAADLVIFVYRDEVYNPESTEGGTAEIIISRNRNGPIGTFFLKYDGQHQRFIELR